MSSNEISDNYLMEQIRKLEAINYDREFGGGVYRQEIIARRRREQAEAEAENAAASNQNSGYSFFCNRSTGNGSNKNEGPKFNKGAGG